MGNTQNKIITKPASCLSNAEALSSDDKSQSHRHHNDSIMKLGKILEEKSVKDGRQTGIDENIFQKYICRASRSAGCSLFMFFMINEKVDHLDGNTEAYSETLSLKHFVKQSERLLDCFNDCQQLEYYINVFARGKDEVSCDEISELLVAAYEMAQGADKLTGSSDDILAAVTKTLLHGEERVSCKYIHEWMCQYCPRLVRGMHLYIRHMLTVAYATTPQNTEEEPGGLEIPSLECASSSSCAYRYPALIWMISCSLPSLYMKSTAPSTPTLETTPALNLQKFMEQLALSNRILSWISLYNSNDHGLSINRFQHHVFEYQGPTLVFIKTDASCLFCLACDDEWRDSKHFFGADDCMFLQLLPEFKVIEKRGSLIYFNKSARGFPAGLHIGRDHRNSILSIDVDLQCVHYQSIPMKLQSLEAWGCSSSEIKAKQADLKQRARRDAENRQKVKLDDGDWKNNPDMYLLEMAGTRPKYFHE